MRKLQRCIALVAVIFLSAIGTAQAADVPYQLSTHILDIAKGMPAQNVEVELYQQDVQETWHVVGKGITDKNGRISTFLPLQEGKDNHGVYKLKFMTQPYFKAQQQTSFYPYIEVVFQIEGNNHYHVPITLSNYGYSTYRGS
ncbi:MAG: 5-hydroxyisourate hydrolase [Candidatus Erwinia impunctatus]|nr:5-hydroxyisourate hydrolase [Culicoides impunctatus]